MRFLLILVLSSCCHQEATVIQTRAGIHGNETVYAYQVVINSQNFEADSILCKNDTLWIQSDTEYKEGDKINWRFR